MIDMFKNWEWLRYLSIFFLYTLKGVMWIFCFVLLSIFILYTIFSYQKIKDLKESFVSVQKRSATIFPFLTVNQKPILQFRKRPHSGEYEYVLSYELTDAQMIQAEQYLNKIPTSTDIDESQTQCIEPTIRTRWLFPRISRHYVDQMYSEYNSFLIYGSDKHLHKIEQACSNGKFQVAIIERQNDRFNQTELALSQSHQIFMVNFKHYNSD